MFLHPTLKRVLLYDYSSFFFLKLRIIQAVEETVMSVQIEGEDYISKSETFDVSIINVNEETRQSDIQFPKEESKVSCIYYNWLLGV